MSDRRMLAAMVVLAVGAAGALAAGPEAKKPPATKPAATRAERERAEGFRWIFDGKTLAGWSGSKEWFRAEDGAIVGGHLDKRIPRNEFLTTDRAYGDFELRLKVKLVRPGGNAGIQVRSARIPDHHEMRGYQADVGGKWWGKLYDESRRRRVLAGPDAKLQKKLVKRGEWNDYVIRCRGRRIQLWLNGRQTVDYTETDKKVLATPLARRGLIGLQIHSGAANEAHYKDIRIKELRPATAPATRPSEGKGKVGR